MKKIINSIFIIFIGGFLIFAFTKGSVSGYVVDKNGEPLSNVSYRRVFENSLGTFYGERHFSNTEGEWKINNARYGNLCIEFFYNVYIDSGTMELKLAKKCALI